MNLFGKNETQYFFFVLQFYFCSWSRYHFFTKKVNLLQSGFVVSELGIWCNEQVICSLWQKQNKFYFFRIAVLLLQLKSAPFISIASDSCAMFWMNLSPGRGIGGGAGGGCHAPCSGRRHMGVAQGVGFVERVRSRGCHRRSGNVTVQAKDKKNLLIL